MEIERQFLVKRHLMPDLSRYAYNSAFLRQWYFSDSPTVIRLRSATIFPPLVNWELTFKGQGLVERAEVNIPISEERALALIDMYPTAYYLEKVRYRIAIEGGLICELDRFTPTNFLAEVELVRADQPIIAPPWFGLEVSENPAYKNMNIAKFGFPA